MDPQRYFPRFRSSSCSEIFSTDVEILEVEMLTPPPSSIVAVTFLGGHEGYGPAAIFFGAACSDIFRHRHLDLSAVAIITVNSIPPIILKLESRSLPAGGYGPAAIFFAISI